MGNFKSRPPFMAVGILSSVTVTLMLNLCSYAQKQGEYNIVQNGDTFSEIIYKIFGAPLYGKNGYLKKYLEINSGIGPDKIYPNQKIRITEIERTLATDNRQQTTDNRQQTTDNRQQTTDNRQSYHSSALIESKNEPYSSYFLSPVFYFSTLQGTDSSNNTSGELVSKLNFGLNAAWKQNWTEKFSTSIHFALRKEEYYSSDNITLENTSQTLGIFGFGGNYNLNESLSFNGSLNYSQELFYRAKAINPIVLESVPIPKAIIGLSLKLLGIAQY